MEQIVEILLLQLLAIFFKLLVLQFFTDSHKTCHTWFTCQ